MPNFFKKKDESSSSEEDSSDEDVKKPVQQEVAEKPKAEAKEKTKGGKQPAKPQFYGDDSSESENEKRVVKKTTDKRTEALEKVFLQSKAHTKNKDFGSLLTDFELIQEEMDKCIGSVFANDKL